MDGNQNPTPAVNWVIDGARLRQLREEAGLSLSALARTAALSKNQIEQLENGGDSLFYNPGVKRQAARKLATLLGVDPKTIVTDASTSQLLPQNGSEQPGAQGVAQSASAVPAEPEPAPMPASKPHVMAEPQADRVVESTPTTAAHVDLRAKGGSEATTALVPQKASHWPWLIVLLAGLSAAAGLAWQQRWLTPDTWELGRDWIEKKLGFSISGSDDRADPAVANAQLPALPNSPNASTEPINSLSPPPTSAMTPSEIEAKTAAAHREDAIEPEAATQSTPASKASSPCPERLANLPPSYAPQANKSGARVHILSNQAITVCVEDATGQAWVREVRPHLPQTFIGKAPWWISSKDMEQIQIFFQGWRVTDTQNAAESRQILLRERAITPSN
jgi:transcriptional regulator with XRE-family HTH domain